ncbi:hypothetical protein RJ639_016391 [Escallonia herrerae]|uniref:Uncharacterized protein n=1 Tax=Escallonia herrerae TaxID=1293975 RepID=A0AA88VGJ0_9ASTE|nr:hypothetical protein RJ639_016391 [Escallonia herrerae]
MAKEFEMIDISLMLYYLGIEVKQRDNGNFISQEAYEKDEQHSRILWEHPDTIHNRHRDGEGSDHPHLFESRKTFLSVKGQGASARQWYRLFKWHLLGSLEEDYCP